MARIRTIKPEFWTNEKVVACSLRARLLFIALWNFADDSGRLADVPKTIKMQAFAGDDITTDDTHGALTELSVNDLIIRYMVEGKAYIQVKGWHHQKINRPVASKIPPVPHDNSLRTHGALTERSSIFLPEGKGRDNSEGKGAALTERSVKPPPAEPERDIVGLLERACSLAGIKPTHAVNFLGIGKTWLGTGLTDDQILDAITAIVDRPGYTAKRTLAYFTQAITDHAEALKHSSHATAKPGESTPEQQQAAIDWYTERFAADGTWHPSIGPQPGHPGCRSSPELLKRLGLPATPDAQDAAS